MLKASGGASRVLAVLLVLAPVFGLSLIAAVAASTPYLAVIAGVWGLLYLIATIMVIVEAVMMFRRGDADALGSSARLVKYCGIPFFTTNFAVLATATGAVLLISSMFAAGAITGALAALAVPILVVGTYLAMLPTSVYGIAGAVLLRRQGRASTAFAVVNVILHLIFVVDIFSTLVVASRAKPGPARGARMVRWVAVVVVLSLLVPAGLFIVDTPGREDRQQVAQQREDAMSKLPGVAGVTDMTVELAPGVTFAQARAIAVQGYTSQDNTSMVDSDRWTMVYGSARLVLKGLEVEDTSVQTLQLLGPAAIDASLALTITASQPADSEKVTTFIQIQGLSLRRGGKAYTEAVATIVRVLALADPQRAAAVGSVVGNRWSVSGGRLRSADTAAQLDALGAVLSDDVALDELFLKPTTSEVILEVSGRAQIGATCQLSRTALADYPGLTLSVHRSGTSADDAKIC